MKKIVLVSSIVFSGVCLSAKAQSGTNSPYSQYGLGVLSDQSQGFNSGMGGLGIGLRGNDKLNVLNPASYSSVDSLTMVFDIGLSGQITNFSEGGKKVNARNADFEYAIGLFRVMPKFGVSFGLLPFSNIGYSYTHQPDKKVGDAITSTDSHSGSGGLRQAFVGFGWTVFQNVSFGANFSYLWGSYDKSIAISSSNSYVNTIVKRYNASVSNYKLDFGLQWQNNLSKDWAMTIGATYGLGHNLKADVEAILSTTNSQSGVSEETSTTMADALSIPHTFGVGMSFKYADNLTFGADYKLQKWGSLDYPELNNTTGEFVMKNGMYSDRHKVAVGGEWIPNKTSRHLFDRIRYRVGASFSTPYIKINGKDGPKEYSVGAGFGIPVMNVWNNGSVLNISGQWVHSSATSFITENTFRINIGLTFNERWFMKWKVD